MTVKELREKLDNFRDDLIVYYPSELCGYCEARHVSRGTNEFDGMLFIDNFIEGGEDDA